jgi:hypothetical protein
LEVLGGFDGFGGSGNSRDYGPGDKKGKKIKSELMNPDVVKKTSTISKYRFILYF